MESLINSFSNRELALFIWLGVFLLFIFLNSNTRTSFFGVVKAICNWKLLLSLLLLISYTLFIYHLFFGNILTLNENLKEYVYWLFVNGLSMWATANKINHDEEYFIKILVGMFKADVWLIFVINLYSFSLFTELILLPIIFLLAGVLAYAETQAKYKDAQKVAQNLLALITLILIIFSLLDLLENFKSFQANEQVIIFLIPIIFTLLTIPLVYCFSYLMMFEILFMHLKRFKVNQTLFSIIELIIHSKLKLKYINYLNKYLFNHAVQDKNLRQVIKEFNSAIKKDSLLF